VEEVIDVAGDQSPRRERLARGREHPDRLIIGSGRSLSGEDPVRTVYDGVREGAPNVNGECRARCHAQELNSNGSLAAPVGRSRSLALEF
jgi:hypothetical protein